MKCPPLYECKPPEAAPSNVYTHYSKHEDLDLCNCLTQFKRKRIVGLENQTLESSPQYMLGMCGGDSKEGNGPIYRKGKTGEKKKMKYKGFGSNTHQKFL